MAFRYIALTPGGEQIKGSIDAPSEEAAEDRLWEAGYRVVALRPVWTPDLDRLLPTMFGVKPRTLIVFSRQLATLVESGIALLQALEILQRQQRSRMASVVAELAVAIKQGVSFSEAVGRQATVFPPMYAHMIAVGERTGSLEIVLRQTADHMEKDEAIVKRVRGAMAYPAFVVVLSVFVAVILVTAALPPLITLFDEFDQQLPLPTRILLALSKFATSYGLYAGIAMVVGLVATALYVQRPKGHRQMDGLLVRAPLIGQVTMMSNTARVCRTMAMLFRAGLPLSEIIGLVIGTTQNRVYRERLNEVGEALLRGEGLSTPLARTELFPPLVVQMIEVGEETGTLDANLETMGEFYANELDERIAALTSMIQPALTLAMGAVVAFIAISIIMPMYQIVQSIQPS